MATGPVWRRIWGDATALFDRARKFSWVDPLVVVALGGVLFGLIHLAHQWTGPYQERTEIDLSPGALPLYTFYSLCRGLLAYLVSLGFTLVYAYWAAKDRRAERVLIPMLDILQSIPVLSFLPGLVLALAALFPTSNIGLELAAVLMIFTGQAWNMTFSFYHSLRTLPLDQREAATIYRFNWWQRFKWVELPYSTMGLVWNSMMSMAGGWFFLTVSEAFTLGTGPDAKDFRLPGIGSYMSAAIKAGREDAILWAILAMTLMIVALDQLLWRPVVVWAQKFRVEEGGAQPVMSSWFLNFLRRSHLLEALGRLLHWRRRPRPEPAPAPKPERTEPPAPGQWASAVALAVLLALLAGLAYGTWELVLLMWRVSQEQWGEIAAGTALTLGRVLLATALGTLWTVPAGLAIGLSPRLSYLLQPVVQVLASFPAPMLFPLVIGGLTLVGVPLGWGSIVLMLLGTQWYILFNVIAGAMAVPADLREAARSYRLTRWQRFRILYLPAVFPYLVTGWVTAAGGAWNASIVSEYVTYKDKTLSTQGVGALIFKAAEGTREGPEFPLLAASTVVMATVVVLFNRLVWRRLYRLAEDRFSLTK
jgi:NitT/TauT family transport system permease protein